MKTQRAVSGARLSMVMALIGGVLASPAQASEIAQDQVEVESEISPEMEAAEVADALNEAAESSGEDKVPTVAAYDLRISDDDQTQTATGLRTKFPIPEGCTPDLSLSTLECETGTTVFEPSVLTLEGGSIEFDLSVTDSEIIVSAVPRDDLAGPFLFSLFMGDETETEILAEASETLEWMLAAGPEADRSADSLAAEEAELTEALEVEENSNEGADENEVDPGESVEATPAVFDDNAAAQASLMLAAAFKRPSKVTIPSRYVYCKTWVTSKCKPKSLHDYCTWSPDSYTYKGTKVDYRGPCARHDMAIDSIRQKKVSLSSKRSQRASADSRFKSNLRQNCGYSLYKTSTGRAKCYDRTALYYSVVKSKTKNWNGR